ncbi:MAG: hydrogenase [Bryobacteraceae bacterium]|nr:MAG: hydrogenase [Bryobacteraceae bacterium]
MPAGRAKTSRTYRARILCCGRMDWGDDAVGPLCASALADRRIPALTLHGSASELLEAWREARHVIIVDAFASGALPGTIHRMKYGDPSFRPELTRSCARGPGLAQAVRLGESLHCLPETLVLLGIEGADFEWASTPSPEVAAAMPALVELAAQEWKMLVERPAATGKR